MKTILFLSVFLFASLASASYAESVYNWDLNCNKDQFSDETSCSMSAFKSAAEHSWVGRYVAVVFSYSHSGFHASTFTQNNITLKSSGIRADKNKPVYSISCSAKGACAFSKADAEKLKIEIQRCDRLLLRFETYTQPTFDASIPCDTAQEALEHLEELWKSKRGN
jgi:hypothetical protein